MLHCEKELFTQQKLKEAVYKIFQALDVIYLIHYISNNSET